LYIYLAAIIPNNDVLVKLAFAFRALPSGKRIETLRDNHKLLVVASLLEAHEQRHIKGPLIVNADNDAFNVIHVYPRYTRLPILP
jgi:hypothetical protein